MSEAPHRMDLQQLYDFYLKLVLLLPPSRHEASQPQSCSAIIESSREQKKKLLQMCLRTHVDIKARDRIPGYIAEILDENVEKCSKDWNQSKWIDLFAYIEEYTWNVLNFSWKKEYQTILMYSGFYKTCIERLLPLSSERIFAFLGYKFDEDRHKLCLTEMPDVDTLRRVAFDCFKTQLEMYQQFDIVRSLAEDGATAGTLAAGVYKARKKIGDSKQICIDYMRQQLHKFNGGNISYNTDSRQQFNHSPEMQHNHHSQILSQSKTVTLRPSEKIDDVGLVNTVKNRNNENRDGTSKILRALHEADSHSQRQDGILTFDRSKLPDSRKFSTHRSPSRAQHKDIINLVADDDLESNKQMEVRNLPANSCLQIFDSDTFSEESLRKLRLDPSKSVQRSTTVVTDDGAKLHHSLKQRPDFAQQFDNMPVGRSLLPSRTVQSSNILVRATGSGDVDVDGSLRQCKQPSSRLAGETDISAGGHKIAQPQSRDSDISYADSEPYVGPADRSVRSRCSIQSLESVPYLEANYMPALRNQVTVQNRTEIPPNHAIVQPNLRNIKCDDVQNSNLNTTFVKSITEPITPSLASRCVTGSSDSSERRSQTAPIDRGQHVTSREEQRQSDEWQCLQCTYLNSAEYVRCEICAWQRR